MAVVIRPPFDLEDDEEDEFYPSSDGKPMAESILHRDLMIYAIHAIGIHLAARPDVWVSGNDFVYYEEGDLKARTSPDCYVVFGVERKYRPNFKIWEEGRTPSFVLEFTSRKTRKEDKVTKFRLYEQVLKVPEYFLFDPTGKRRKVRLSGFRLVNGRYEPIPVINGRLYSEVLGLELVTEGEWLRLYDAPTGKRLLTHQEDALRADAQEQRADVQEQRAEVEAQRADAEAQARLEAVRRAEAEAQRAAAAEAELARLRAELEILRRQRDENSP
jgi:Uma2 family endonuclease